MESFFERPLRAETEQLLSFADVEATSRLPVGLRRIPNDLAFKAGELRDEMSQIFDADFVSRAEIDGIRPLVPLGCKNNALRGVVNVKEFARRGSCSPQYNLGLIRFQRLDALPDDGGDDVRRVWIEVIAWTIQVHRK